VNTYLLDSLCRDHRGARDYVAESEDVGDKVMALFGKLAAPVLAHVRVTVEGVSVREVTPKEPVDLYLGDQIVLCGRYRGCGEATVVIEGRARDETRRLELEVDFPERDARQKTVACLWARRRIGFLLDEMRLNGVNDELVDEVIALSRRYRVVTPYTAFLITEDADLATLRQRLTPRLMAVHRRAARSGFEPAATPAACLESLSIQEACR
jgi:Ca-activated chloride channel family protein